MTHSASPLRCASAIPARLANTGNDDTAASAGVTAYSVCMYRLSAQVTPGPALTENVGSKGTVSHRFACPRIPSPWPPISLATLASAVTCAHCLTAKQLESRCFFDIRQATVIPGQPLSQVVFNSRTHLGIGCFIGIHTDQVRGARVQPPGIFSVDKWKHEPARMLRPRKKGPGVDTGPHRGVEVFFRAGSSTQQQESPAQAAGRAHFT